jgi:hypothetical protein
MISAGNDAARGSAYQYLMEMQKSGQASNTGENVQTLKVGKDKDGEVAPNPKTTLNPEQAAAAFRAELAKLQAEGKLPTQNWFMGKFFPNFTFVAGYGVLLDGSIRTSVYATFEDARDASVRFGGSILMAQTKGDTTIVYLLAASGGVIPEIGNVSPMEMMRFVILHEAGHHAQFSSCDSNEACADRFARARFKPN